MDGGSSNIIHNSRNGLLLLSTPSSNNRKKQRRRKRRKRIPQSLYWSFLILVLYWRFGFVVEYIFSYSDNNQKVTTSIKIKNYDDDDDDDNGSGSTTTSIIQQQKLSLQQQQQQQQQQKHRQFPPERQEDWLDDIDTSRPAPCGWRKCLFESKSNDNDNYNNYNYNNDMRMETTTNQRHLHQQKRYGYLVFQKYKNTKVNREQIDKGWMLAQTLTAKFGIRHLLLGPPYHINNVTDQLATDLNQNTYKPNGSLSTKKAQYHSTMTNDIITTTTDSSKYHPTPIILQPVEILSNVTSILFGVTDSKTNAFMKQFQDVITNLEQKDKNHQIIQTSISYDKFKLNLHNDINSTKVMFKHQHIHGNDDDKYYLLLADFQIMFDLQYGYIYHLDFDRYYEILFNKQKSWIIKNRYNNENLLNSCMNKLDDAIQQLLEWKKKNYERRRRRSEK